MSAKPSPCSTPPSTWLRACSGEMTRPMSCTATMRSTVISPVAASTATCAIWQPNVFTRMPSGFGPREPVPTSCAWPSLPVISVTGSRSAPSSETNSPFDDPEVVRRDLEARRRRARAACRAGRRRRRAPRERPTASSASRPRRARRRRSASSRPRRGRGRAAARAPRRRPSRTPSSRPVPMSCAPVTTVTTPSWPMRTSACAGGPPPPHQIWQAAPRPRTRPSACSRSRSASRSAQPASSAARSMQAERCFEVYGRPLSWSTSTSLARRRSSGSSESAAASSSIALS